MSILDWVRNWKFDIGSGILTIVLLPVGLFLLNILRKYVKEWGRFALEGILFQCGRMFHAQMASHLALRQYARLRLGDDSKYLHVPSSRDIKLAVDKAFVTLSLEHFGSVGKVYDHNSLLTLGNRIRVVGDPGSGKSSLVKRLLRDACHAAIGRSKQARLPFLIELRSLELPPKKGDKDLGSWLLQKIRSDLVKTSVYQMQECFDSYVKDRGLLVLLDGLDEVATASYSRVQAAINGLSQQLAQYSESNTMVLTMRTQFHQQIKEDYRNTFGPAVFLKPFSPSDIYEFLSRWHFDSNPQKNITRIYSELTDRPSLREMCGNPLVLAMYVAEDQAHGHVVAPDSRTEFYRKVTEELIIKRRLQQTGPAPAHTKLREQREQILGRLAYDHMLNADEPANSLRWSTAIAITMNVMNCGEVDAETLFLRIASETGLVSEERPRESLRFIHLTFCEFLAALEAVQGQSNGWQSVVARHRDLRATSRPDRHSRLVEVIPFCCGLVPRVDRAKSLSDIAALNDSALLARCFLETKLYEHDSWTAFVEAERKSLLSSPETEWNAEWLRRLHMFNVVARDALECAAHSSGIATSIDLDEFFRTLLDQQQGSLATLLHAYANQDAAAAFRLSELSRLDLAQDFPEIILKNCDQAPFFALVREQVRREPGRAYLWAALLTEAAYRSSIVLRTLVESAELEEWSKITAALPQSKQWTACGILPGSFLTQCLTLALAPDKPVRAGPAVEMLCKLPVPYSFRAMEWITTLFGLGAVSALAGWLAYGTTKRFAPNALPAIFVPDMNPVLGLGLAAAALFLILAGYLVTLRFFLVMAVYRSVLLRPHGAYLSAREQPHSKLRLLNTILPTTLGQGMYGSPMQRGMRIAFLAPIVGFIPRETRTVLSEIRALRDGIGGGEAASARVTARR